MLKKNITKTILIADRINKPVLKSNVLLIYPSTPTSSNIKLWARDEYCRRGFIIWMETYFWGEFSQTTDLSSLINITAITLLNSKIMSYSILCCANALENDKLSQSHICNILNQLRSQFAALIKNTVEPEYKTCPTFLCWYSSVQIVLVLCAEILR